MPGPERLDPDEDLVGLGEAVLLVALDRNALVFEGPGEGLGVGPDLRLEGLLELVHLVGGHEQGEQRPEVVVRGRAREGPGLDIEPEVPERRPLGEVAGDEAALGAEERLVRAAR